MVKKHSIELISRITPDKLVNYLTKNNWILKYLFDNVKIFVYKGVSDIELLVPSKTTFGDYVLRISEAIALISKVENRYEIDIIRDILNNNELDKGNLLENLSDGNYDLPKVNRVDIILNGERIQHSNIELSLSVQDDGHTLKIFIDSYQKEHWDAVHNMGLIKK